MNRATVNTTDGSDDASSTVSTSSAALSVFCDGQVPVLISGNLFSPARTVVTHCDGQLGGTRAGGVGARGSSDLPRSKHFAVDEALRIVEESSGSPQLLERVTVFNLRITCVNTIGVLLTRVLCVRACDRCC